MILNGIEDLASRADLLDRSILLHLPSITEENRMPERSFWERFERIRPRILGVLLDAVALALRRIPDLHLDRVPRTADFAYCSWAAEPAFGFEDGTFLKVYSKNRNESVDVALDASPVVQPLRDCLILAGGTWTGNFQELLDALSSRISDQQ